MKRLLFLAPLALAVVAMGPTSAATTHSNWTALNKDLAPVNVKMATDIELFGKDLAAAGKSQQGVFFMSPLQITALKKTIDELKAAENKLAADIRAISADALAGMKVLDGYTVEQCFAHFYAYEFTMFATWYDAMAALNNGVPPESANAGIYLGGFSTVDLSRLPAGGPVDLQWNHVKCQGATPSAAPPSPSPSAS